MESMCNRRATKENGSKRTLVWNRRLLVDFNVRLLKCNFHILDVNDVMTSSRRNLAVVATITIGITITITVVEWHLYIGEQWSLLLLLLLRSQVKSI